MSWCESSAARIWCFFTIGDSVEARLPHESTVVHREVDGNRCHHLDPMRSPPMTPPNPLWQSFRRKASIRPSCPHSTKHLHVTCPYYAIEGGAPDLRLVPCRAGSLGVRRPQRTSSARGSSTDESSTSALLSGSSEVLVFLFGFLRSSSPPAFAFGSGRLGAGPFRSVLGGAAE